MLNEVEGLRRSSVPVEVVRWGLQRAVAALDDQGWGQLCCIWVVVTGVAPRWRGQWRCVWVARRGRRREAFEVCCGGEDGRSGGGGGSGFKKGGRWGI